MFDLFYRLDPNGKNHQVEQIYLTIKTEHYHGTY